MDKNPNPPDDRLLALALAAQQPNCSQEERSRLLDQLIKLVASTISALSASIWTQKQQFVEGLTISSLYLESLHTFPLLNLEVREP